MSDSSTVKVTANIGAQAGGFVVLELKAPGLLNESDPLVLSETEVIGTVDSVIASTDGRSNEYTIRIPDSAVIRQLTWEDVDCIRDYDITEFAGDQEMAEDDDSCCPSASVQFPGPDAPTGASMLAFATQAGLGPGTMIWNGGTQNAPNEVWYWDGLTVARIERAPTPLTGIVPLVCYTSEIANWAGDATQADVLSGLGPAVIVDGAPATGAPSNHNAWYWSGDDATLHTQGRLVRIERQGGGGAGTWSYLDITGQAGVTPSNTASVASYIAGLGTVPGGTVIGWDVPAGSPGANRSPGYRWVWDGTQLVVVESVRPTANLDTIGPPASYTSGDIATLLAGLTGAARVQPNSILVTAANGSWYWDGTAATQIAEDPSTATAGDILAIPVGTADHDAAVMAAYFTQQAADPGSVAQNSRVQWFWTGVEAVRLGRKYVLDMVAEGVPEFADPWDEVSVNAAVAANANGDYDIILNSPPGTLVIGWNGYYRWLWDGTSLHEVEVFRYATITDQLFTTDQTSGAPTGAPPDVSAGDIQAYMMGQYQFGGGTYGLTAVQRRVYKPGTMLYDFDGNVWIWDGVDVIQVNSEIEPDEFDIMTEQDLLDEIADANTQPTVSRERSIGAVIPVTGIREVPENLNLRIVEGAGFDLLGHLHRRQGEVSSLVIRGNISAPPSQIFANCNPVVGDPYVNPTATATPDYGITAPQAFDWQVRAQVTGPFGNTPKLAAWWGCHNGAKLPEENSTYLVDGGNCYWRRAQAALDCFPSWSAYSSSTEDLYFGRWSEAGAPGSNPTAYLNRPIHQERCRRRLHGTGRDGTKITWNNMVFQPWELADGARDQDHARDGSKGCWVYSLHNEFPVHQRNVDGTLTGATYSVNLISRYAMLLEGFLFDFGGTESSAHDYPTILVGMSMEEQTEIVNVVVNECPKNAIHIRNGGNGGRIIGFNSGLSFRFGTTPEERLRRIAILGQTGLYYDQAGDGGVKGVITLDNSTFVATDVAYDRGGPAILWDLDTGLSMRAVHTEGYPYGIAVANDRQCMITFDNCNFRTESKQLVSTSNVLGFRATYPTAPLDDDIFTVLRPKSVQWVTGQDWTTGTRVWVGGAVNGIFDASQNITNSTVSPEGDPTNWTRQTAYDTLMPSVYRWKEYDAGTLTWAEGTSMVKCPIVVLDNFDTYLFPWLDRKRDQKASYGKMGMTINGMTVLNDWGGSNWSAVFMQTAKPEQNYKRRGGMAHGRYSGSTIRSGASLVSGYEKFTVSSFAPTTEILVISGLATGTDERPTRLPKTAKVRIIDKRNPSSTATIGSVASTGITLGTEYGVIHIASPFTQIRLHPTPDLAAALTDYDAGYVTFSAISDPSYYELQVVEDMDPGSSPKYKIENTFEGTSI